MARVDASVALGRCEQHGRIVGAIVHMVIGRVGVQPAELLGHVGVAVLIGPQARDQELREANHVQQRHRAPHGRRKVGALCDRDAHQKAAVAAAVDGKPFARGVALRDQPVGSGVEVVEHALLVGASAGMVPCLAVLVAATQPGDAIHTTGCAPSRQVRHPHR